MFVLMRLKLVDSMELFCFVDLKPGIGVGLYFKLTANFCWLKANPSNCQISFHTFIASVCVQLKSTAWLPKFPSCTCPTHAQMYTSHMHGSVFCLTYL